jgi:PAS domain S-box-containing protein
VRAAKHDDGPRRGRKRNGSPRSGALSEVPQSDRGEVRGPLAIAHDQAAIPSIQEELRRIVVDAAPNAMLVIDEGGTTVLANAAAERVFGYGDGAPLGLPLERLLTGLHADPARLPVRGLQNISGRRRDGGAFAVEATFGQAATAHGTVIIAALTDLTDRGSDDPRGRASEAALADANRLMTMAQEMAHYGQWRINLRTNAVYWSIELYRILGWPTTYEPTLEAALALYDPDGVDVSALVRQAAVDGKPFSFETRILRPDKTLRDVRCSGRGELDADGVLSGLVGIFADITERKDAERVRDQLVRRVSRATECGKVGTWEWDTVANVLTWDTPMYALYGVGDAGAAPSYEYWLGLLHEDDRLRVATEFSQALSGTMTYDTEFRVVWANGELHTIRAQATILRNLANEPVRMVGINWDTTEVRVLAEQMREEHERLQVSERDRLYEHARKWSTTFQRAVLPLALPQVAGCLFDAVYEPGSGDAQVGGDWYDAVHLPDGRVFVSIGDVSGSGLRVAVVVGVVRQIMRGISQLHANPMLILDAADRALCLEYPGVYVSAWVGLIDLVTRTMTYASAGHPPPLARRSRRGGARAQRRDDDAHRLAQKPCGAVMHGRDRAGRRARAVHGRHHGSGARRRSRKRITRRCRSNVCRCRRPLPGRGDQACRHPRRLGRRRRVASRSDGSR